MGSSSDAIAALDRRYERTLAELIEFARIPGVSADSFDPCEVERSAEFVAALLKDAGLYDVEILRLEGAHPYVVGSRLDAGPDAPTALIYAHHDVQPPGRAERWETAAFEPTIRADGRLYGRGVVDDKAGVMIHVAAIRAWLESVGSLPINVKLIVEGEEEIGSPHLAVFLRAHEHRLASDVIVLSDTANLQTGLPSLTTSLRGLVVCDLTVRTLSHPLHSGMWGGPVLDAASALTRILARLVDDQGVIQVPKVFDDVSELSDSSRARLEALPFDAALFAREAGLVANAELAGEVNRSVYERLWWRPSLAITATETATLAASANQLIDEARARLAIRLAPSQDASRVAGLVSDFLKRDPPGGAMVEVEVACASGGWSIEPEGPAFDAARRALQAGFETDAVEIGCGGSIPFVAPFSEVLGGVPALLLGLEDPICNAHGENESLELGDFRKACRSAVYLLDALSRVTL